MRTAITQMTDLPVLRTSVHRVLGVTNDPDSSTTELVAALEADESLVANMLRYANSAAMARPVRAKTVRQAVTMLGRLRVRQIALEAATYHFLEQAPGVASRGQLHVHSVAVAAASSAVADRVGLPVDTPHLAGLLHDIGKVVLPAVASEAEVGRLTEAYPSGMARARAERDRLGIDHAQAGAILAAEWGLPEDVAAAIAWHHGGPREMGGPGPAAACVQLANGLVGLLGGRDLDAELMLSALDELGLPAGDLESLAETAVRLTTHPPEGSLADRVGELERLAQTDELTGLANRRHWVRETRLLIGAGRGGSALLLDLDNFKEINDSAGHAAGDLVLTEIAAIVSRHGRAGRLGGDEFCVWVEGGRDDAEAAARQVIAQTQAFLAAAHLPSADLGVSVGVAVAGPGEDLELLLARADVALYAAKAAGRGRVVVAE
ncbi:MAG: HDOD domain-containing protein [Actinomycetota bacterium]